MIGYTLSEKALDKVKTLVEANELTAFEPGAVVRLKSGGPLLTVEGAQGVLNTVVWFADQTPQRAVLPSNCLELHDPKTYVDVSTRSDTAPQFRQVISI